MTSAMLQVSLLFFLVGGSLAKGIHITCHLKTSNDLITAQTPSGIFSIYGKKVYSENRWEKPSCSEVTSRVHRECIKHMPRDNVVCNSVMIKLGHWVLDTKIPVFVSGKADCAADDDQESWMVPVKMGDICCSRDRSPYEDGYEVKGCNMWKRVSGCNC